MGKRILLAAGLSLVLATAGLSYARPDLVPFNAFGSTTPPGPPPAPASAANGPVRGETYAWRPVAIGAGGFISGISFDDKGITRVIRTDVHGAYIWRQKRNRWELLTTAATMPPADRVQNGVNEGVYEIAVAPSDPTRIYMALKGSVYHSTDRGAHWLRPDRLGQGPLRFDPNSPYRFYGPFLAVDPANPDLVLFSTPRDGSWRSPDGGRTWDRISTLPPSKDLSDNPNFQAPGASLWFERGAGGKPTGRIWAAVPGRGIFVSGDKGARFAPLTRPGEPAPETVKRGTFAPDGSFFAVDHDKWKVWRFFEGHWSDLTQTAGLDPRPYAAVAADRQNGAIFLLDEGGHAFRSTNGGARWWRLYRHAQVGKGDPPWLRVVNNISYFATGDIAFDPVAPHRLWVTAGVGLYRGETESMLPELSLTSQSRGIEELVATDVIQPSGQSPIFSAWDFGIHVKDDLNRYSETYGPRERVIIGAQQIAWGTSDPRAIVTNASDTRTDCCSEDGQSVLAGYSHDAGRTWSRFSTLPTPPGTSPGDPWRMAFGMIAVAADDSWNIVWAPSNNRSPYYSRDRGENWSRVVLPGETLPNTGSHSAYYFNRKTLVADRVLPGTFYMVHSGDGDNPQLRGLWRSKDGGWQWRMVFSGEIAPRSQFAAKLRAVPGKAGHLFFTSAVADAADSRLRRSVNGGESWTVLDDIDHVDDIAFGKAAQGASYPTLFLSGRIKGAYGIWRSVDNAASWQRVAGFPLGRLDQVMVLGADPDVFGRVYVGYMGSGFVYGEPAPCRPARTVDVERACATVR